MRLVLFVTAAIDPAKVEQPTQILVNPAHVLTLRGIPQHKKRPPITEIQLDTGLCYIVRGSLQNVGQAMLTGEFEP